MHSTILKIIREGWPMRTEEVFNDLVTAHRLKLPWAIQPPASAADLMPIVSELEREGQIEKVAGGWKWIAPEPVKEVKLRERQGALAFND